MNTPYNFGAKKKILLITRYFPPLDSTATARMYSWAKYLSRAGFDVSILTTSKKGQVVMPLASDSSFLTVYEVAYFDPITFVGLDKKVTLHTLTEGKSKRNLRKWFLSRLSRIYRERLNERMPGRTDCWIIPAVKELKRQKKEGITYDYVVSSYGPPSSHVVGYFAKNIFQAHWTADYRDLWIENHIYVGLWPFTLLEKLIESKIIARADAITSVSGYLVHILQEKFPNIPASVIENGYDEEEIDCAQSNYFSSEEKKFRIVYTGSIYRGKRDPTPLFRAIRELMLSHQISSSHLEVLFWGNVAGNIEELIDQYQLSSVARYGGTVSKQDSLRIQKSADALLFLEWSESETKDILTAKIFEYMATEKPVLAVGISAESTVGRLIEKSGSGIACGNNVEKIKSTLLEMINNGLALEKNSELIGKFSREAEVGRFIKCLKGEVIPGVRF